MQYLFWFIIAGFFALIAGTFYWSWISGSDGNGVYLLRREETSRLTFFNFRFDSEVT